MPSTEILRTFKVVKSWDMTKREVAESNRKKLERFRRLQRGDRGTSASTYKKLHHSGSTSSLFRKIAEVSREQRRECGKCSNNQTTNYSI